MCMPALGLIGAGLNAFSQIQAGRAAQKAHEYNAQMMDNQAQNELNMAARREENIRRETKGLLNHQIGAIASAGLDPSTGSPLKVLANSQANIERDVYDARLQGGYNFDAKKRAAALERFEGKTKRNAGYIGGISSFIKSTDTWNGLK